MAHVVGTLSQHDQFKKKYADKIGKYLSCTDILQEKLPFTEKERTGEEYVMPIMLRRGHSADYAASGAGQVSFGDLDTSEIKKAALKGSQIFMGDGCDWESSFSSDGDKVAFTDEFDIVVSGLMDSHRFRIEMDTLWGQSPNGSIGIIDGTPATANPSTVTILLAERSPGILFQIENALIEIFSANLGTKRTGPESGGLYRVLSVDPDAGTFTLDNSGGNLANTDRIFFKGQVVAGPTHKSAAGLHKWFTNAGSLAGIDASTRVVWKPNTVSAGNGPLTFDQLLSVAARLANRSHNGRLCAIVTPQAWNNAMADMSAVVRRTPQERKYVLGAEAIEFYTGVGTVEVIAHPYAKNGYAHVFPILTANADGEYEKEAVEKAPLRRIGATDLTFVGPDGKTGNSKKSAYFEKLQRTNLLYVETYSHQAPFVACPARTAVINNIVND
jgi:hypothetical protein